MDLKEDCFHLGVKALILNTDGKLLLLQKNSKSYGLLWDLPGGRIQKNESLEAALMREVYEETGLTNITPLSTSTMMLSSVRIPLQDGDVGLVLAVYIVQIPKDHPPIQLSNEHLQYLWALPEEAATLLATHHPSELITMVGELQQYPEKRSEFRNKNCQIC